MVSGLGMKLGNPRSNFHSVMECWILSPVTDPIYLLAWGKRIIFFSPEVIIEEAILMFIFSLQFSFAINRPFFCEVETYHLKKKKKGNGSELKHMLTWQNTCNKGSKFHFRAMVLKHLNISHSVSMSGLND